MNPRISALFIIPVMVFMLCGCSLIPDPDSSIEPPAVRIDISSKNDDASSVANGFLPKGFSLITPSKSKNTGSIIKKDIDGDGQDEIILLYSCSGKNIASGIMVLKKGKTTWGKVLDSTNDMNGIDSIEFSDITGDGIDEIIAMSGSDIDINFLKYGNSRIGEEKISCSSYSIEDLPGEDGSDGMDELVVRRESSGLSICAYRWNGYSMADVTCEYPQLSREVMNYYKGELNSHPNNGRDWYALAEAEKSLGLNDESLESLSRAISYEDDPYFKATVQKEKGDLQVSLRRFEEAAKIYNSIKNEPDRNLVQLGMAKICEAQKKYDDARKIYNSISPFVYDVSVQVVDAKEGEGKIYEFLKTYGQKNMNSAAEKIEPWGRIENLNINCITTKGMGNMLFIDFNKDPFKAYGKDYIGGHAIYWWDRGKLCHQVFYTVPRADDGTSGHEIPGGLISERMSASVDSNGRARLIIIFKDAAQKNTEVQKIFVLTGGRWKLYWK